MTADVPDTGNVTEEERTFPIAIARARRSVPAATANRLGGLTQKNDTEFSTAVTSDDGWPRLITLKLTGDDVDTRVMVRVETLRLPMNRFTMLSVAQLLVTAAVYGFMGNAVTLVMLALAAIFGVAGYVERRKIEERTEREARERRALIYKIFGAVESVGEDRAQVAGYRVGTVENVRAPHRDADIDVEEALRQREGL